MHDFMLFPINVGHECQILMNNNNELHECQQQAFNTWILPLLLQHNHQSFEDYIQNSASSSSSFPSIWIFQGLDDQMNGQMPCCYRWALLDCLFESLQKNCPLASTFDSRTFLMKRDEVIFYYESFHCKDYPFGTIYCHLSIWSIVGLILLIVILLLLIIFLSIYVYRFIRKTEKQRQLRRNNPPTPPLIQKPRRRNLDSVTDL